MSPCSFCVYWLNENPNLQKKKLWRLGFFFQNWGKSHLNSIGNGAKFQPLRKKKKSLNICFGWELRKLFLIMPSYLEVYMLYLVMFIPGYLKRYQQCSKSVTELEGPRDESWHRQWLLRNTHRNIWLWQNFLHLCWGDCRRKVIMEE